MSEQDEIYSSKISYEGIFNFKEFYKFCYDFLAEQKGIEINENEYSEKLIGPTKEILVKWTGKKKVTDYFKFELKIEFRTLNMSEIEINKGGVKLKTNKGKISVKVKANLIRDYEGKFETSSRMKFWRGIYEKWIISQRIKEFEDKLIGLAEGFLEQAKAFLDLEGRG